jgi:hypothetical protein
LLNNFFGEVLFFKSEFLVTHLSFIFSLGDDTLLILEIIDGEGLLIVEHPLTSAINEPLQKTD